MILSPLKPPLSFPTLSGSIVTFNSQYAGLPLKACKVNIPVTQEGTGDPSPDNVRNFIGISSLDFTANSVVRTFQFGQIVYAGILDILTGVFTATTMYLKPTSVYNKGLSGGITFFRVSIPKLGVGSGVGGRVFCNVLKQNQQQYSLNSCRISTGGAILQIVIDQTITTEEDASQWLIDNDCTFIYVLAEPEIINLGGMDISLLQGENNLFASTGETSLQYPKFG